MAMTPAIAAARSRKKRRDAAQLSIVLLVTFVAAALVTWLEYRFLDFAAPVVRSVGIGLAWVSVAGIFAQSLVARDKRPIHAKQATAAHAPAD